MQITKRKRVLGIPLGRKKPIWSTIGGLGAAGVAGLSAVTGTVAAIRHGMQNEEGSEDEELEDDEESQESGDEDMADEDMTDEEEGEEEDEEDDEDGDAETNGRRHPETSLRHVIQEQVDVAVPVKTAYNQWTQFAELPEYTRGVEDIDQDADDLTTWNVKIGPRKAQWTARIVEQIPDERIAWQSEDGPDHRGVITFHRLSGNLTRVQVDMELIPHGPIQKMGMRAVAARRRVRKDLELFRHNLDLSGEATGEWRGEIHSDDDLASNGGGSSNGNKRNGGSAQADESDANSEGSDREKETADAD
jgi:uncharacterized membrane protein